MKFKEYNEYNCPICKKDSVDIDWDNKTKEWLLEDCDEIVEFSGISSQDERDRYFKCPKCEKLVTKDTIDNPIIIEWAKRGLYLKSYIV